MSYGNFLPCTFTFTFEALLENTRLVLSYILLPYAFLCYTSIQLVRQLADFAGVGKAKLRFPSGPSLLLLLLLLDLSRLISIYRYMHGTLVVSSRSNSHRSFFQEETFPFKDEVQYYIYSQCHIWESTS